MPSGSLEIPLANHGGHISDSDQAVKIDLANAAVHNAVLARIGDARVPRPKVEIKRQPIQRCRHALDEDTRLGIVIDVHPPHALDALVNEIESPVALRRQITASATRTVPRVARTALRDRERRPLPMNLSDSPLAREGWRFSVNIAVSKDAVFERWSHIFGPRRIRTAVSPPQVTCIEADDRRQVAREDPSRALNEGGAQRASTGAFRARASEHGKRRRGGPMRAEKYKQDAYRLEPRPCRRVVSYAAARTIGFVFD